MLKACVEPPMCGYAVETMLITHDRVINRISTRVNRLWIWGLGEWVGFVRGDNLSWKSVVKKNAERGRLRHPLVIMNEAERCLSYEFPIDRFGEGFRCIDVCDFVAGATINPLETEVARMVEIEP